VGLPLLYPRFVHLIAGADYLLIKGDGSDRIGVLLDGGLAGQHGDSGDVLDLPFPMIQLGDLIVFAASVPIASVCQAFTTILAQVIQNRGISADLLCRNQPLLG
jgi:hypothetical protein